MAKIVFEEKAPQWKSAGSEPPQELKDQGFQGGYKPPAAFFNWFWHTVSQCLGELHIKLEEFTALDEAQKQKIAADIGAKLDKAEFTPAKIIALINTGAGLNADTVDGKHASAFAGAAHSHSPADITETVPIAKGGTGAVNPETALVNLGLTAKAAELNYTKGLTSSAQTQINGLQAQVEGKQAVVTGAASTVTGSNLPTEKVLVSDIKGKISSSEVKSTELGNLSGSTSNIQTQLNGKQPTITGAATTITGRNLTADRALVTDVSGKVAASSTTTSKELSYLSGVTSAVQTQLNGKAANSHTHSSLIPIAIPTSADLNSYVSEGDYFCDVDSVASSLVNCPASYAFVLEVKKHTVSGVMQRLTTHNPGAAKIYIRSKYNSTWGIWQREYTTSDKPTPSEIGAAASAHTHGVGDVSGVLTIAKGGTSATTAAAALVNLGLSATAAELNRCDGVTSNIQTQLNGKAASSHSHTKAQISDFPASLPASGGNADTVDGKHAGDFIQLNRTSYTPYGISYCTTSLTGDFGKTGFLIKLPFATNSKKMLSFTISLYGGYTYHKIVCSGYLFATTDNWYSPMAEMIGGNTDLRVIMGKDENGRACVWIPARDYMGISVTDITFSYAGGDANSGWEIIPGDPPAVKALDIELRPTVHDNDPRLANARTPLAHTHAVADISGALPISKGGTGATTAAAALSALGLKATAAELNYLDGTTSSVQTQLNSKQPTITGAVTTITGSNLTASRALISDSSGKVAVSPITATELGYLDGVTSGIQTQLNGKAASSHTHSSLTPIAIPTSADLNGYVNPGDYRCVANTTVATLKNCPTSNAFALEVKQHAGILQRITEYMASGSNPKIYFRNMYDGVWLAWQREYTTIDKPTPAEIGAAASAHTHGVGDVSGVLTIAKGGTSATTAAAALVNLGLTATAAELNRCDGVTSNIQTQLNGKAASSHSHPAQTTVSGNAGTASRLLTARTINGVAFDGSANITIADSTKEPAFTKNAAFNKAFGTATGTVCQGNDSRLSNARTPLAHTHAVADISGALPISKGGTGATTAANALINLGLDCDRVYQGVSNKPISFPKGAYRGFILMCLLKDDVPFSFLYIPRDMCDQGHGARFQVCSNISYMSFTTAMTSTSVEFGNVVANGGNFRGVWGLR